MWQNRITLLFKYQIGFNIELLENYENKRKVQ